MRRLKDALAPPAVLAALGLPPGTTNAEAIAANLIARASASDCDAATIKTLLDRLTEIEPPEAVQISVRYVEESLKNPIPTLKRYLNALLDNHPPDDVALATGYLLATLQNKGKEFEDEFGKPNPTVVQ